MKKVTRLSIAVLASCLALSSCDDKNEAFDGAANLPDQEILIPATARATDFSTLRESATPAVTEAEEFAKMLAFSLKDAEMRKFLKSEANKQFDGDFDILVNNVVSANVGNARFEEKVKSSASKGYTAGSQAFSKAIKNPLLNISVPMLIENWNDTKQLPLVAVAVGTNEKETKQLKAFDVNGKTYLIDAKIDPNVPVIVVGNNERVVSKNGKFEMKEGLVGAPAVINASSSKSQAGARVAASTSGCRQDDDYLKVTSVKMDIDAIESWYRGKPDVVMQVKKSVDASITGQFYYSPARNKDDQWVDTNDFLFRWKFDDFPEIVFVWIEEDDRGESTTYKIEYDKFKLEIPIQVHDIVMWNPPYSYDSCPDGPGDTQELSGGAIKWKIKSYR